MVHSSISSLKIKAKLLQKAKRKKGDEFALKDAYAVIAKTAGYSSWKEMKDDYETSDVLNPPQWSAQWKVWFASLDEAREYFQSFGGYLVPYLNQFFVCDSNYINSLGIEMGDSDLLEVGRDWTSPANAEAWKNLLGKIMASHKNS